MLFKIEFIVLGLLIFVIFISGCVSSDNPAPKAGEAKTVDGMTIDLSNPIPCKENEVMEVLASSYDDEVGYLRGVDSIEVVDMGGLFGTLSENEKKKAVDELNKGLKGSFPTKNLGIAMKLMQGNTFGAALDLLNAAIKNAIANTLSSWVAGKTVSGTPQWVDVGYGKLWDVSVVIPTQKVDIYKCCPEEHIFVKDRTETRRFQEKYGKCMYASPGAPIRYTPNLEDLDITGCKSGSCPNAWTDAINKALNYALTVAPLQGRIVGDCPGS